jgi:glucose/arabinose dehydrogenase
MRPGALEPVGGPDTVVKGLPPGGNHFFKTFVIDPKGVLYVNVGSATNACQSKDRQPGVPGADPCVELETRAGIWKFDARKLGQTQATGEHYARGIRNAVGMDIHPGDNVLWTTQHGRDQLNNWPQWNDSTSAESPGEELFRVTRGDDFGWPYCYYDMARQAKLLAPEYGGDGRTAGRCADKKGHVAVFPAHWAPNGLMFYRGTMFPARYREGAFIAFHGSWNRAPMPQQGFRVVFQPLRGNAAAGPYETFLSGFFEDGKPTTLGGRPTGLGQGPDGAIYVADDMKGRVWRITYTGTR